MKKIVGIIAVVLLVALGGYFFYQQTQNNTEGVKDKKEVIKIGAILPLTGPAGSLGVYYKNGLKLKVKQINDQGGFHGRKVELLIEDSKTSSKEGVNAAMKLMALKEKPLFIFSHLSSVTLAITPILAKNNLPVIAVSASDKLLNYKYAIRNYVTPERLAKFSYENFSKKLGIDSFDLIYVNDDFGNSVASFFKEECNKHSVKINFESTFDLRNTDYKNVILKLIQSNSKGVYITGYGKPLALFVKQLKDYNYKGVICTGIEITQPEVISYLGDYANDIYFPNLLFNDLEKENTAFNEAYKKEFNSPAFSANAMGYDGLQIMLDAFYKANYDNDIFIKIMNNKFMFNSLNGKLTVSDREIIYPFTLNKLEKGKIVKIYEN